MTGRDESECIGGVDDVEEPHLTILKVPPKAGEEDFN